MTTGELYEEFLIRLKSIYEEREAANIADWVIENVTGLRRWERRNSKKKINDEQSALLKVYLDELLQHKPVQYVLHEAWFYKMKFYVNEDVLIPRPETEELVSWIVNDVRIDGNNSQLHDYKVLDIGTGCGCIAISLKKEFRNMQVTAIDISDPALSVAQKNADALQSQIGFLKNNFLNESKWSSFSEYDIIVSNPPYIPKRDKETMSKNVTEFEPGIALFVPDDNPFIFYNKIGEFAKAHLKKNGKIYAEIHENYSREVQEMFNGYNFKTEIKKDMYGKERIIKAFSMS